MWKVVGQGRLTTPKPRIPWSIGSDWKRTGPDRGGKLTKSGLAVAIGYGKYFPNKPIYMGLAQFCCIICGCCFYVWDFHWKNCCRLVTELDIFFGFQLEFSFEPTVRTSESPLWSRRVKLLWHRPAKCEDPAYISAVRQLTKQTIPCLEMTLGTHWHKGRWFPCNPRVGWLAGWEVPAPVGMRFSPRNNTIDLFEIYFQEEEPDHMPEILNLKTIALFKDARQKIGPTKINNATNTHIFFWDKGRALNKIG